MGGRGAGRKDEAHLDNRGGGGGEHRRRHRPSNCPLEELSCVVTWFVKTRPLQRSSPYLVKQGIIQRHQSQLLELHSISTVRSFGLGD